jgi:hypothetical protein
MVSSSSSPRFWWSAGACLAAAAAAVALLSFSFHHGEGFESRPIVAVTLLLTAAGVLYFAIALRALKAAPPLRIVLPIALVARLILIPSRPIQEDDIYRYLWDGRVTASGLDPYRFSPRDIERYEAGANDFRPEDIEPLSRLVALKRSTPEISVIFSRVNNPTYASIYPPPVQTVFRAHARLVPPRWTPHAQVVSLKALLAGFDLATLAALVLLLRLLRMPAGLSVLYGWCPLVLKEFSNSGHMDSIPTLFVVLALCALVGRSGLFLGLGLGAAFAAKFYALITLPLGLRALGWKRGAIALGAGAALVAAALLASPQGGGRRERTLLEFALTWENHDALFLWVRWLWAFLTGDAGVSFAAAGALHTVSTSYLLALGTVLIALAVLVLLTAWRTRPDTPPLDVLRRAFAILAALFLLGPLGFPWYFVWCVPLLPFVNLRAWFLLPALLPLYYLGFWFRYHYPGSFGAFASGEEFFDNVVVSAEFGAFFLGLGVEIAMRSGGRARAGKARP